MDGPEDDPRTADTEARIELSIPQEALTAGASAVSALASATTTAFEHVLAHEGLRSTLTEAGLALPLAVYGSSAILWRTQAEHYCLGLLTGFGRWPNMEYGGDQDG